MTNSWQGVGKKGGCRVQIGQKLVPGLPSDQNEYMKVVAIYGGSANLSAYYIITYDSKSKEAFCTYTFENRENSKWPLGHVQQCGDQTVIVEVTSQEQQGAKDIFEQYLKQLGKNITKPELCGTGRKRPSQPPVVFTPEKPPKKNKGTKGSRRSDCLDSPDHDNKGARGRAEDPKVPLKDVEKILKKWLKADENNPEGKENKSDTSELERRRVAELEQKRENQFREMEQQNKQMLREMQQHNKQMLEHLIKEKHLEILMRGREITDKDIEMIKILQ